MVSCEGRSELLVVQRSDPDALLFCRGQSKVERILTQPYANGKGVVIAEGAGCPRWYRIGDNRLCKYDTTTLEAVLRQEFLVRVLELALGEFETPHFPVQEAFATERKLHPPIAQRQHHRTVRLHSSQGDEREKKMGPKDAQGPLHNKSHTYSSAHCWRTAQMKKKKAAAKKGHTKDRMDSIN